MEDLTPLGRLEKKAAFKKGFRKSLRDQGLTVADLPTLLEKQSYTPILSEGTEMLTGLIQAGGRMAGPLVEFGGKWLPMAAVGAGGLVGLNLAFAKATTQAGLKKIERQEKKVNRLLTQAARTRKRRKKKLHDRQREEGRHLGRRA